MPSYTDAHRLFLQAFLLKRITTEEDAQNMYRKCYDITDEDADDNEFHNFMATINDKLSATDMEFRKCADEVNGKYMWALVNTRGDNIAQVATEYNPSEIAYFKHLIDCIMEADDEAFSISSMNALTESSKINSNQNMTKMTKKDAEAVLERFVKDRWLIKSKNNQFSLSTRTILELQNYLKEAFGDVVKECTLCLEILTKGQRCQVAACAGCMHHHCATRYFATQSTPSSCPTCRSRWNSKNIVGDLKYQNTNEYEDNNERTLTKRNTNVKGKGKGKGRAQEKTVERDDESDVDMHDSQDEEDRGESSTRRKR